MTELSKETLKSYLEKREKAPLPAKHPLQSVKMMWTAARKLTKKTFNEDGAAAGSGAGPTNVSGGLASIKNPDGTTASPPVSRKRQKSYQQKNAAAEKAYVADNATKLRKVLGTPNA